MRALRLSALYAVLLFAAAGFPNGAFAEEAAPRGGSVEERIDALDQRQRILERNWELQKEEAEQKGKAGAQAAAGKSGVVVRSGDGNFQLKAGGFVHADGRFYLGDDRKPATNTFLVRRAFLNFEGTVYRNFVFRIQPDFGGSKVTLQDAYLDAQFAPAFRILVGKTKVPFLLERIQSATDRRFVELAFPNSLSPNRDIGAFAHGELGKGVLTYAVGVFNGLPDGDTSDGDGNDDKDGAARVFAQPFKASGIEPLEGFGIGIAATYGNQQGAIDGSKKTFTSQLPSVKTSGQQTFFSYLDRTGEPNRDFSADNNVVADGNRTRISPQAHYYWGPLGLLGEYVRSSQEVRKRNDVARLTHSAWQAAAWVVVTGEKNSFKHVDPSRPFDISKGQVGALELVVRYSELRLDGDTFPRFADPARSASRAKAWAAGFNWYLNARVKLAANWEQTTFKGGDGGGRDREREKVVLSRVEVAY